MKTLSIDIECYSAIDLTKAGVYRYSEDESFEILLFGYAVDGGEVHVIDVASGEKIPADIIRALTDDSVSKWSFNCAFERVCLSNWMRKKGMQLRTKPFGSPDDHEKEYLDPESWFCSMVWSAYLALPMSLAGVGEVLGLDKQKMTEGKELIRYFCIPCTPTQANRGRTRNRPWDAPEKWETFKAYNKRDVETEMGIQSKLSGFPVPDSVWKEYHQDQEINDRGIGIDMTMVEGAIRLDEMSRAELTAKMQNRTELENPNSVMQMKNWLAEHGVEIETLGRKQVAEMIKTAPEEIQEVLSLRLQLAKSSIRKYQAMQNAICDDGRARGMFQFYGANRTGRFSGKLIQLQNLVRNELPDLDEARELVKAGDYEAVRMLYEDVPDTLAQLVRTAFVPQNGKKYIVADFSAIEARVLAWLAGEQWVLDTFARGGDIYCATASRMFGVPVEKHGVNGELRQKGKQATLSCGYGGGVGALKAMGAIEAGMKEEELQPLVQAWRKANPNIVRFWWEVDKAATKAVKEKTTAGYRNVVFQYESGFLFVLLPSGRRLTYVNPRVELNRFGSESITYEGVGTAKKWERIETFGGKLSENITQALARDVLCDAMQRLRNCSIVAHVHDELIIEADKAMSCEKVCELMGITPSWAQGLILRADGYETGYYRKD